MSGIGIERFTEGRSWSASRVRDASISRSNHTFISPFSRRHHRSFCSITRSGSPLEINPLALGMGSALSGCFHHSCLSLLIGALPLHSDPRDAEETPPLPPRGWEQLVKQTYTAWMTLGSVRRRFHMIYYWRQSDVDRMRNVDDVEVLKRLIVPQGVFRTSRTSNRGRGRKATNPNSDMPPPTHPPKQSSPIEMQASTSSAAPPNPQYSDLHVTMPNQSSTQRVPNGAPQNDLYSMSHYTPEYNYASSAPPIPYPSSSQTSHHPQTPGYEQQNGVLDESIYIFPTPQAQTPEHHLLPPPPAPNISYNWSHAAPHDHIPRPVYHQNESLYVSAESNSPLPIPMSYVTAHMASPPSSGSSLSSPHSHSASEYSGPTSSPAGFVSSLSAAHIPHNQYSHAMYTSHGDVQMSHTNGSALPRSPFAMPDATQYEPFFSVPSEQQPEVHLSVANPAENGSESSNGVDLAPMSALRRFHPYRRDPTDDQLLSVLGNRRI